MGDYVLALLLGYALDLLLGDPAWLTHPVCLIGRYIAFCEEKLRARSGNLRRSAVLLTVSTVLLTMACAAAILGGISLLGRGPRLIAMALMDWLGLAAKGLADEAGGVARALEEGLEAGRKQVARIVGRDTRQLTREEVICAAVETVAENANDGVIAPMLYAAIGGPVLLWGYKAASTLDSMVGYMDDRHRDIGWSSARLDDVLGYVPARMTAALLCAAAAVCGFDARRAIYMVIRDHRNHKSPNCAWCEAAAAGALHIRLGGTHMYFGEPVEKPTIGDADRTPEARDILRTNRMMLTASALCMGLTVLIALMLRR